jgi:tRNA(fMet)-specific endonuclease VapC
LSSFLLDTNAMSDLMKNPAGMVARAIADRLDDEIATSLIVAAELRYGAARRASPRLRTAVEALLRLVPVVSPEPPFDTVYGDLRASLESSGTVLAPHDLLIAAHALTLHATIVTDDQVFGRVPGLAVENWIRP